MARKKAPSCKVTLGVLRGGAALELKLTPAQCARFPPGRKIASGARATAYVKADEPDKIVKFTSDEDDAKAARKLMGARHPNLVRIFDVAKIDALNYAITAERLEPLTKAERADLKFSAGWLQNYAEQYGEDGAFEGYAGVADLALDQCDLAEREGDLPEGSLKDCRRWLPKMQPALAQMDQAGFRTDDLHEGNWGWRGKELVFLDFGRSEIWDEDIPTIDLAGRRKGRR